MTLSPFRSGRVLKMSSRKLLNLCSEPSRLKESDRKQRKSLQLQNKRKQNLLSAVVTSNLHRLDDVMRTNLMTSSMRFGGQFVWKYFIFTPPKPDEARVQVFSFHSRG